MELDTSKLTEGQVFETYPELCRALGCEPVKGNSKPKLLKEFERYFNYEKDGKKFIITEIYPEPISEEYRIAANAKYVGYIQNLLLPYLAQQPEEITYIRRHKLWMILGMINSKYLIMRAPHRKDDLLQLSEDMSVFDINHFFSRSSTKFYDIIKTSLNSLKRRKLVLWEDIYRIGEMISTDSFRSEMIYREATDSEKKYILKTERNVLKEFGYDSEHQIKASNQRIAYYDKLAEIFKKEKGWVDVFSCYKFIYDKSNILEVINEDTELQEMNEVIVQTLNEQAENNYKKKGYTADNAVLRMFDEDNPFFYYKGYQERQRILTDNLMRRR